MIEKTGVVTISDDTVMIDISVTDKDNWTLTYDALRNNKYHHYKLVCYALYNVAKALESAGIIDCSLTIQHDYRIARTVIRKYHLYRLYLRYGFDDKEVLRFKAKRYGTVKKLTIDSAEAVEAIHSIFKPVECPVVIVDNDDTIKLSDYTLYGYYYVNIIRDNEVYDVLVESTVISTDNWSITVYNNNADYRILFAAAKEVAYHLNDYQLISVKHVPHKRINNTIVFHTNDVAVEYDVAEFINKSAEPLLIFSNNYALNIIEHLLELDEYEYEASVIMTSNHVVRN